jgi:hypothetical protein
MEEKGSINLKTEQSKSTLKYTGENPGKMIRTPVMCGVILSNL